MNITDIILPILVECLGEGDGTGHELLASSIAAFVPQRLELLADQSERDSLLKSISKILRLYTNDLRTLMDCPEKIVNALMASNPQSPSPTPPQLHDARPPNTQARFDLLEL